MEGKDPIRLLPSIREEETNLSHIGNPALQAGFL
jgi:hypothetical protein